jgi:hypothetical protein
LGRHGHGLRRHQLRLRLRLGYSRVPGLPFPGLKSTGYRKSQNPSFTAGVFLWPPQLAASFISGQSCDVADGTFQTWSDVRLRSAKRVKADVTEGTVIIATTLEVGRGRGGHCEFHPPRTGKRKRREFSPLSSAAWVPKSRSPARGAIREPVALICRARSA